MSDAIASTIGPPVIVARSHHILSTAVNQISRRHSSSVSPAKGMSAPAVLDPTPSQIKAQTKARARVPGTDAVAKVSISASPGRREGIEMSSIWKGMRILEMNSTGRPPVEGVALPVVGVSVCQKRSAMDMGVVPLVEKVESRSGGLDRQELCLMV
jgi:hypothetical protein